jgi:hypothetical protein
VKILVAFVLSLLFITAFATSATAVEPITVYHVPHDKTTQSVEPPSQPSTFIATLGNADKSVIPGFDTIEEAATDGLKSIAAHPNSRYYEWGGIIVKTSTGKFLALPPNTSYEGSHVHISDYELPPGAVVGWYHTHPCLAEFLVEYFSPADLIEPIFFHRASFIGDFCTGKVHEFKPGDKPDAERPNGGEGHGVYLTKGRILGTFVEPQKTPQ